MQEDACQEQDEIADYEGGWQEMDEFEGLRVFVFQNDTCFAAVFYVSEKRTELDASFVVDKSFREEATAIPTLEDSGTQVDIFSITHRREAA